MRALQTRSNLSRMPDGLCPAGKQHLTLSTHPFVEARIERLLSQPSPVPISPVARLQSSSAQVLRVSVFREWATFDSLSKFRSMCGLRQCGRGSMGRCLNATHRPQKPRQEACRNHNEDLLSTLLRRHLPRPSRPLRRCNVLPRGCRERPLPTNGQRSSPLEISTNVK